MPAVTISDGRTAGPAVTDQSDRVLPPIAWRSILPVVGVACLVASFAASRYHLFGDELYFIGAGRHLGPSYADQGPVLPLLARFGAAWYHGHLVLFRLPGIVLAAAGLVLAALTAREFGGGRRAQTLTIVAAALSPFLVIQAELLATNAIDAPLWAAVTFLLVRWVRTRQDRFLLIAAAVTAVDLQVKWLIPGFWAAAAIAVFAAGPRDLLRRPAIWIGGAVALASAVPSLVWQAHNGWPNAALTRTIAGEGGLTGGRALNIPLMLLYAGPLGAALLCYGVWRLLRAPDLRAYRFIAIAFLGMTAAVIVAGGRPYYTGGLYTVLIAAGSVQLVEHGLSRWLRIAGAALTCLGVAAVAAFLPLQRQSTITAPSNLAAATLRTTPYGQFGWPELTRDVEQVIAALPPDQQPQAVITEMYWQAAAFDYYGRGHLPPVYSYSRGYGYLRTPPDNARTVVWVGVDDDARSHCTTSIALRHVGTDRVGFPTASTGVTIWWCHVAQPWSKTWASLRRM